MTRGSNPEATSFGFRSVTAEEKTDLVSQVFSSVAGRYDLMNDLMSGGLHRLWKDHLVRRMRPRQGDVVLDVAGGTGDVALRCYKASAGLAEISVVDLSEAMIAVGRARAIDKGILDAIRWQVGNAEALPGPARSASLYSIAFGLRNVTRIDRALSEAVRVLRPGGRFFCLEFSPAVAPRLKPLYERYCRQVLPLLGSLVAHDSASYQYLAESIETFPTPESLGRRMERAGFSSVSWSRLSGGIAYLHFGAKL